MNYGGIKECLALFVPIIALAGIFNAAHALPRVSILIFEPPLSYTQPHHCAVFPQNAIRLGQEGKTFVQLTIGIDGAVKKSVVAKSSGYDAIDQAAIRCTSKFTYEPSMKNGVPVETTANAAVAYCLSEQCMKLFAHSPAATEPQAAPNTPGASAAQ